MASPFTNINPNILSNNAPGNADQQSQQSDTPPPLQHRGTLFGLRQIFPTNHASGKDTSTDTSASPGSTFSFTGPTNVNNPFTPGNIPILHPKSFSGTEGSVGGGHTGFRGSIFTLTAGRDSVPQFAPMPSEPLNYLSSDADKSTQPEETSKTAQTPTTTNVFGQKAVEQDKLTPATTNIFGRSITSTMQYSSPSNVSVQSAEKMQISPDITSAKGDAPKTGAFSFLSQSQKDTSTEVNPQSGAANLFSKSSQPPSTPNPISTTTDASTVKNNIIGASSRPFATLKSASAAPKIGNTKGLFSGLLMPPSTPSPLASKQHSSTAETPIQKEKLTNGVSKTPSFAQATGGSQTSNIFRDIVGSSKAPAMESQKEKLTNGVNGATPVSQTKKMPQPFNSFGNTPKQPTDQASNKDALFMGMPPPAPAHFTEDQEKQYVTLYRIRSLDLSFQKHISSLTEVKPGDVEHAVRFYTETHEKIIAAGGLPLEGLRGNKRKLAGDETSEESGSPAKKSKPESVMTPTLQKTQGYSNFHQFSNLKTNTQTTVTNGSSNEATPTNSKPESEGTLTFKNPQVFSNFNMFGHLKSNTQAAVTNSSSNEATPKKSGPESEGTPTPQTFKEPPTSNIFNNLKGNSQTPITNNSFNGASAAKPPNFSIPTFNPPTFGSAKPANFLAQFGQSVAETERKEKAKRKAEDFDSDEDDEAEWERKYAEEQRMKKQKLADAAKGKTAKFVPGKGFVIEEDEQSTGGHFDTAASTSPSTPSTVGGASVFDSDTPQTVSMPNIFGHLSEKQPAITPGKSLFDRISKDENGKNIRELPKNTGSSLLVPSAVTSVASSRATSPGLTTDTGGESANDSSAEGADAETTSNTQQLNLTTVGPGEEDEEVLFQVRAKALMWLAEAEDEQTKQGWQNKGVGSFRLLKHRKTGKTRIVMRLDPSGRLVLNTALLDGVKYEHQAPASVKMAVVAEDGKLRTWVIKVKKDDDAVKLANILEESKSL